MPCKSWPSSVSELLPRAFLDRDVIDEGLTAGIKDYIGGNCTVSLMLMAIGGLFRKKLVEWVSTMTYQSASGAGAKNMRELVVQMAEIAGASRDLAGSSRQPPSSPSTEGLRDAPLASFTVENFGAPLAGSILPWIDRLVDDGQTREEWKGIRGDQQDPRKQKTDPRRRYLRPRGLHALPQPGSHDQAQKESSARRVTTIIASSNEWVEVVPNTKEETLAKLTPAAVTGTLKVPIGRIRKMKLGEKYLTGFTVGDQLLWGAAEPLRRMLNILLGRG